MSKLEILCSERMAATAGNWKACFAKTMATALRTAAMFTWVWDVGYSLQRHCVHDGRHVSTVHWALQVSRSQVVHSIQLISDAKRGITRQAEEHG